jgi:ElaB/YqjD/DUF883 family membrane-anchored ribosome-binding protein
MEQNEDSGSSTDRMGSGTSTANSFGGTAGMGSANSGSTTSGSANSSASSTASNDGDSAQSASGFADRARDIAGSAQDKLADVGSTVRDRTGNLKDSLADALETGADKLRQRAGATGHGVALAGATSAGTTAVEAENRLADVGGKVASGMDATAGWLRDADLDGLKSGLEYQVKEHPGRTLLIAAGIGYLLGKALRN